MVFLFFETTLGTVYIYTNHSLIKTLKKNLTLKLCHF